MGELTEEEEKRLNDPKWFDSYVGGMVRMLDRCESPIESQLLSALLTGAEATGPGLLLLGRYDAMRLHYRRSRPDELLLWVVPQFEVPDLPYRVDFAVAGVRAFEKKLVTDNFVIECDGHDFHERTKQQARADKQRDRAIQATGRTVLRFTGSEIHGSAQGVAQEIVSFIDARLGALHRRLNGKQAQSN